MYQTQASRTVASHTTPEDTCRVWDYYDCVYPLITETMVHKEHSTCTSSLQAIHVYIYMYMFNFWSLPKLPSRQSLSWTKAHHLLLHGSHEEQLPPFSEQQSLTCPDTWLDSAASLGEWCTPKYITSAHLTLRTPLPHSTSIIGTSLVGRALIALGFSVNRRRTLCHSVKTITHPNPPFPNAQNRDITHVTSCAKSPTSRDICKQFLSGRTFWILHVQGLKFSTAVWTGLDRTVPTRTRRWF